MINALNAARNEFLPMNFSADISPISNDKTTADRGSFLQAKFNSGFQNSAML